jgi:hypothetical protein
MLQLKNAYHSVTVYPVQLPQLHIPDAPYTPQQHARHAPVTGDGWCALPVLPVPSCHRHSTMKLYRTSAPRAGGSYL